MGLRVQAGLSTQTLSLSTPRVQTHLKRGSKDENYPRRAGQSGGSATAKVVCLPGKLQALALLLSTCYTHARKAKNNITTKDRKAPMWHEGFTITISSNKFIVDFVDRVFCSYFDK